MNNLPSFAIDTFACDDSIERRMYMFVGEHERVYLAAPTPYVERRCLTYRKVTYTYEPGFYGPFESAWSEVRSSWSNSVSVREVWYEPLDGSDGV